ncbi:RICIN domain-containing protein [Kitasatospora sp. NA04385]|uniref:TIM-barrel domain-containing protein n=1 Tax=Kitasatospora sp. NA04385 TaxID=2742135 RepID=UPI00158FD3B5|nr:TIM-barrel domain-containing protein [Kitasatospora sp. NA04385]QKW22363.1 RICIN domain-containing protein [Kitasatospora sp. NA04385]
MRAPTARRRAPSAAFALVLAAALTLGAHPREARAASLGDVTGVSVTGDTVTVSVGADRLVVRALRPDTVKVDYRPGGAGSPDTPVIDPGKQWTGSNTTSIDTTADPVVITTDRLSVRIARHPARVAIYDSTGTPLLTEPASGGVEPGALHFTHAPGQNFYGITGTPVPHAEDDPKQSLAAGMQRDSGGHVSAGKQGDGGAPLVFTTHYGLLVDSVDGDFDITDTGLTFTGVSKTDVSYYAVAGPPKQVMNAVAEISGLPDMAPKWALGFNNSQWGSTEDEVKGIVDGYRSRQIPLDAFTMDFDFKAWGEDDYGEFRWNSTSAPGNVQPDKYPDGASGAFARDMADRGVHLMGIMKPRIVIGAPDGGTTAQGRWARDNGCLYPGRADYPEYFSGRLANDIDFSQQKCRDWYWQHAKNLADTGIAGWWNDEADEANGTDFDSLQHTDMQRALYEGQSATSDHRVFSLNRNFYLGAQRYGYGMWSGDIDSDATTLANQRTGLLTAANIGETRWGMDIGGFTGDPTDEAYARWMEFGAFVPVYRVHGTLDKKRQPWLYGPAAQAAATKAIDLRMQLMPYLYANERTTHETGIGLVRPLFYDYPDDPAAANLTSEWMFGDSLLVAPVVEMGATGKSVYLPAGTWTDWARGTTWTGPTTIDYPVDPATLQDIPLFVKGGGIVATQPVQQYTGQAPVTQLDLNVFPADTATDFTVYDDDGLTTAYKNGSYYQQKITARRTADTATVRTDARTGSYDSPLRYNVVKINRWDATGVTVDGATPAAYPDLTALEAADGEGWTTGTDQYGPYTAVKVRAGQARTVQATGSPQGHLVGLAGKCADVSDGDTANGTPVQLWDCAAVPAQQWTFTDGKLHALGKCLDLESGGTGNGTRAHLWDCLPVASQTWERTADGQYRNPASGRCLDVYQQSTANGTRLHLWDCHSGTSQKWSTPR